MTEVLEAFLTIAVIVAAGIVLERSGVTGPHTHSALGRLAFHLLVPVLLFRAIAETDVRVLVSTYQAAVAAAAAVTLLVTLAACRLMRKGTRASVAVGLSACYPNAVNIGIPVALQLFGDITYITPLLLMELLVIVPVSLCAFEAATSSGGARHALLGLARNPLMVACVAGLTWCASGAELPTLLDGPTQVLGGATIPVVLLAFGMSLAATRPFTTPRVADTVIGVVAKLVVAPVAALAMGWVMGLGDEAMFALVTLSALPTAQNAFVFAQRYGQSSSAVRDVVMLTTALSAPAMVAVVALMRL